MELVIRGRRVNDQDLAAILSLLSNATCTGRSQLSLQLCRAWNWVQPNGNLKEAACRALLLQLELRGLIVLPPRKSGGVGRRPSRRVSPQLPSPLAPELQARHGYTPVLLETFVDTTRFKGTCYKAANWIFAGLTQGRGKYDRHTRRPETVKAVWLYPLRKDFRQVLCHG